MEISLASHESVTLPGGWLVRVEAPGCPRQPSSIQRDAVVNCLLTVNCLTESLLFSGMTA